MITSELIHLRLSMEHLTETKDKTKGKKGIGITPRTLHDDKEIIIHIFFMSCSTMETLQLCPFPSRPLPPSANQRQKTSTHKTEKNMIEMLL